MALKISGTNVIDDSLVAVLDATYVKTMTVAELLPNAIGEVAAYSSGGTPPYTNTVDTFPFSTPFTTATDAGDLSSAKAYNTSGHSSTTDGYTSGGYAPGFTTLNVIDSFPFSAPFATATDAGDLLAGARAQCAGQSSDSRGYTSGGFFGSGGPTATGLIDAFPFSTPFTTGSYVGSLAQGRGAVAGISSPTDGYTAGGYSPFTQRNTIDKFPFSSPTANASDVGDLSAIRNELSGQGSKTDGYTSGGNESPSNIGVTTINKFPFSTPFVTASTAGNLSQNRRGLTGQSSSTYGYASGGNAFGTGVVNTIDKFPFSTPFTTATDAGDLSSTKMYLSGQVD